MCLRKIHTIQALILFMAVLKLSELNAQNLDNYRWKKRILIIQTTKRLNTTFSEQIQAFKNLDAQFKDRKLLVFKVANNNYQLSDNLSGKNSIDWKEVDEAFKNRFKANTPFQITLIGLDGGIKLQQTTVLKSSELFNIIDSMPMRSAEIRNKG